MYVYKPIFVECFSASGLCSGSVTLILVKIEKKIKSEKNIGWTQSAILCRGEDASGRWPNNPRPDREEFGPKALGVG